MTVESRAATAADVPGIAALTRAWEAHWFGAPEHDEDEVAEELERVDLAANSRLVVDPSSGAMVGFAWWGGSDSALILAPDAGPDARDMLLDWFDSGDSPSMVTLDRDEDVRAALERRGWTYSHSGFELLRPVADDWTLDEPRWPAGVEVGGLGPDDAEDVHRLIYEDARWADVPDHVHRDLEQWRSIFFTDAVLAHRQLVARRGGRPVGVALGRIWSDGTGWVLQLAVSVAERGNGLGRALLLGSLRQRVEDGADQLGLGVQGANRGALQLYLGVGLRVDREWQSWSRPGD